MNGDAPIDEAMDRVRERERRLVQLEDRVTQLEKDQGEVRDLLKGIRNYILIMLGTTVTGVITAGIVFFFHWNK
jgi:hypothetical protein